MELILPTLVFFVFGSILGSFLCVLVDRLPRGEQVISGRSKCESCHKVLTPLELIPVFSYIALRGKCLKCHKRIPPHVFLVETFGGLLSASFFYYTFSTGISIAQIVLLLLVFFALLGIFLTDVYSGIIPDEFVVAIIVLSFTLTLLFSPASLIPLVTFSLSDFINN